MIFCTYGIEWADLSSHPACVVVSLPAFGTFTEFSMFYLSSSMSLRCYVLFSKRHFKAQEKVRGLLVFFFLFSSGSALDIKGYIKERMDS